MFRNPIFTAVVSICLGFLLGACASSGSKEEGLLHLQEGSALLQSGKYPEALRELLLAEKDDPKNPVIQNNLGLAYFIREKNEIAEKHLARALDLKSDYSDARNNLGRVLIEEQKYKEALHQLKIVTDDLTYSDTARAFTNISLAYFRSGEFEQARKYASQALRLNRQNCLASTLLGRSLLELQDYKDAAGSLDTAVVLCKPASFDEPHYFAGLAYDHLGQREKAVARLEEVVRLYPSGKYKSKAQSKLNEFSKQVQQ